MLAQVEHDFYHLPCYVGLSSWLEHGEPKAFYSELPTGKVLIPLLVRNVPPEIFPDTHCLDATSPYGYPCPLFSKEISPADAMKAIEGFIEFGKAAGLVTTFLRLHPFIGSNILSALPDDSQHIKIIGHGATISMDLTLDVAELDARLRRNHRRNIQRLLHEGYTTRIDDWSRFAEFIEIYHQTMRRCGASAYYFFDHEYFAALQECLGSRLHLCLVLSPDGDMACGGLFVKTGDIVQAHLAATAEKYISMAPSKLTYYQMRNWSKNAGAKIVHLGGGVGGQQDSLYLYKRGLGTDEHRFFTIGIIHDPSAYATFYENWSHASQLESKADPAYFPFYRGMAFSKE